jgi:hypothetical protein
MNIESTTSRKRKCPCTTSVVTAKTPVPRTRLGQVPERGSHLREDTEHDPAVAIRFLLPVELDDRDRSLVFGLVSLGDRMALGDGE